MSCAPPASPPPSNRDGALELGGSAVGQLRGQRAGPGPLSPGSSNIKFFIVNISGLL